MKLSVLGIKKNGTFSNFVIKFKSGLLIVQRKNMKLNKAKVRDKKRKKRNQMIVNGKSVFIIQQSIIKRVKKVKDKLI